MIGELLAHYKVTAKLGEGGMGVVYRATDTKLGREVALKVLPDAFARDPERLARFRREAHVLASLNHPNIAAIYGMEERAIVMELVEGETLRGPLPVEAVVHYARQLTEAIDAAHEKGITHRDLKPANIKVTPEGVIKVLDFGLAKAAEETVAHSDPDLSPTMTIGATRAGVIMGTAAYMSPEQARGNPVDKRTDIWAFGVVVFELLTGKRMFGGETVSDTLSEVLKSDIDWKALPKDTPPALHRLLRRCLERDRKKRLRDIGEAWQEAPPAAARFASRWPLIAAGVLAVIATIAILGWYRDSRTVGRSLMRLDVSLGQYPVAINLLGTSLAFSPDGTRIAFVAHGAGGRQVLFTRRLDQSKALELSGTQDATSPFFSPDGKWVAFFAGGKLKRISAEGGAPVELCDAPASRGGSWGENGEIIACLSIRGGLVRIPSGGGNPVPLTRLDPATKENTHRWPQVLPGAKAVVFTSGTAGEYVSSTIDVASLATGQRKTLQRGAMFGRYLPSGYLAYIQANTMFAAPMDADRLELTGPAVPVLDEVATDLGVGCAHYTFSETGTLAYLGGKFAAASRSIQWLDSSGRIQPLLSKPGIESYPAFSPDGKRLALTVSQAGNRDIWVYEWERDTMTRLTFEPGVDTAPVWAPDGRHIAYASLSGISWIRADGSGGPRLLVESSDNIRPNSFTPDGKLLAYGAAFNAGADIMTVALEGDAGQPKVGKPEVFLKTPFSERYPAFSSDGRWLAYQSDESGGFEIYVRPFPGGGGKWQVSTGGGVMPVWSRNGRELFYRTMDNRIMVAAYTAAGETFTAGKPRVWSDKRFYSQASFRNFDLAPDGKRFAVLFTAEEEGEKRPGHVTFLLNFFDEVRRRAPVGAVK